MALFEEVQSRDSNQGLSDFTAFPPCLPPAMQSSFQEWLPWCTYMFIYRSLLSICQQGWEQGGERRLTIKGWQQLARGSMRKTSSYIWNVHAKSLRKYHLVCWHWTQNNTDVFTSTLTFKARWLTLDKINCFFFFLQLLRKGPLLICLGCLWLEKTLPAIYSRVVGIADEMVEGGRAGWPAGEEKTYRWCLRGELGAGM